MVEHVRGQNAPRRNNLKTSPKMTYEQYSIRVGTDAGYYGSQCTDADALRIAADVAKLIEGEFPGINVTTGETSKSVTGPDEATCDEIREWVDTNWMAAL